MYSFCAMNKPSFCDAVGPHTKHGRVLNTWDDITHGTRPYHLLPTPRFMNSNKNLHKHEHTIWSIFSRQPDSIPCFVLTRDLSPSHIRPAMHGAWCSQVSLSRMMAAPPSQLSVERLTELARKDKQKARRDRHPRSHDTHHGSVTERILESRGDISSACGICLSTPAYGPLKTWSALCFNYSSTLCRGAPSTRALFARAIM